MPSSTTLSATSSAIPLLSVTDMALELGVPENAVRAWLSDFHWERRYDAQGQLCFSAHDADLFALIKSLDAVENSCAALQTRLGSESDGPPCSEEEQASEQTDDDDDKEASDLEQVASLKAELRELHGNPAEPIPFWQFWKRW
jgi:DNA-binding transcriptional MerR regulator